HLIAHLEVVRLRYRQGEATGKRVVLNFGGVGVDAGERLTHPRDGVGQYLLDLLSDDLFLNPTAVLLLINPLVVGDLYLVEFQQVFQAVAASEDVLGAGVRPGTDVHGGNRLRDHQIAFKEANDMVEAESVPKERAGIEVEGVTIAIGSSGWAGHMQRRSRGG